MKRITVEDDVKAALAEAIKVADTREKLSSRLDGGILDAEGLDESAVLREALREFITDQHNLIVELADDLSNMGGA